MQTLYLGIFIVLSLYFALFALSVFVVVVSSTFILEHRVESKFDDRYSVAAFNLKSLSLKRRKACSESFSQYHSK